MATNPKPQAGEPPRQLAAPQPAKPDDWDALSAVLRLAVGGVSLGMDELLTRLRRWDAEVMDNPPAPSTPMPLETDVVRVRYAVIGALFSATRQAADTLNDVVNYSNKQSSAMYRQLDQAARTPLLSLFARPLRDGVDNAIRRRNDEVERLVRIGRVEERDGRRLGTIATDELLAELIKRVGDEPAVIELVQNRSLDLAGGMVDEVRQSALTADNMVESIVWRLLGRKPRESALNPPSNAAPKP